MDPVSDMFIRIKNSTCAGHPVVRLGYSKFKHEIAKALERAHVVGKTERKGRKVKKILEIQLPDKDSAMSICHVMFFSKPSRRLYASAKKLRSSRRRGVIIVSTPQGVMTVEEARKANVGGMLIAEVW